MKTELVLVGYPGEIHIGAHLRHGAGELGVKTVLCDCGAAFEGPRWLNRVNWWLRGRRPTRLREFSDSVVQTCREKRPRWLLSTGVAPLDARALQEIRQLDVQRVNYLTDDPWNPAHRGDWFLDALPLYDHVYAPRQSILEDLRRLGCPAATFLPFAYAPEIHYPEVAVRSGPDLFFAGGADRDRVPYIHAAIRQGFSVDVYGSYWERHSETAGHARGMADAATLRRAVSGAKVCLCLVRRSNRDGHVMRTFEVPAMGGCMLTEDTAEHREILGPDGEAVVYFRSIAGMVDRLRWLLAHEMERKRLAAAAQRRILAGQHTYRDRLTTMLKVARA